MLFKPLDKPSEFQWMEQRAAPIVCADSQGIIAFDDYYFEIQAAAMMDSWGRDSCNVHLAIDNPMVIKYGFIHEIARHIVNVGRTRVFSTVRSDNLKSLQFTLKIGMDQVAIIPDGFATGVDYHIMRLDLPESRWIREESPYHRYLEAA